MKGFNFLISGTCNEQFRSLMIKQMREWAGNLQPQFLLTALLLGTDQLHGFAGVEGKIPWEVGTGSLGLGSVWLGAAL